MFNRQSQTQGNDKKLTGLKAEVEKYRLEADQYARMLESVNNSTHLSIWMAFFDESGKQTGVRYTDEMRKTLGYSASELPDKAEALGRIIHPEDSDRVYAAYDDAVSGKTPRFAIDYRLLTKSGDYRMFHAAGECVRRHDKTPEFFIGTFTDIQDQIETKDNLETSNRRQGAVEQMMLEGSWSMDLTKYAIDDPNSPMVFSKQFKSILGYTGSHDFPDVMNSWISKMHPDDVKAASDAMGRQLSDPTGRTVFDMEYRMLHRDGEYRWVRASSMVVWSKDRSTPLMAAGTILDITDEKKNKIRLKEEMAPKIESLRSGIRDIATTVKAATDLLDARDYLH